MKPLLIFSDNPTGNTGLGRVTAQLACNIQAHLSDVFKVGVIGIGPSAPAVSLPYPVYPVHLVADHVPVNFEYAWREHCGGEEGILLTIGNAAWFEWLAFPERLPYGGLREFLLQTKFQKWCYVPVDAESVGGKLPAFEVEILEKMDRLLAYTKFGESIISRSVCQPDNLTHLPHGTDSSIFYSRSRREARKLHFGPRVLRCPASLSMDTLLLGIVATNTKRKKWPLAFETLAELNCRGVNTGIWAHTDRVTSYWDLVATAEAFGVRDRVQFTTGSLSDEDMAWGYASCDVVLGIGREGWGLPLSEALACGIPVVTGNYAGATEFVPEPFRVMPYAWDWDGLYCSLIPVFRAADWADRIEWAAGADVKLDPKFTWDGCWPAWEAWLKEEC